MLHAVYRFFSTFQGGDVLFTPRKCCFGLCTRSKSKDFYDVRKRHHQLYYHFKPGKVYWLSVIIFRKFAMSLIALFFRANIIFMLATMLFVLFINYVLTAKHRPYMSTVERERVKESHLNKVEEAQGRFIYIARYFQRKKIIGKFLY